MKRKIENYLNSKDKNEYTNLDRIFEMNFNGELKKSYLKHGIQIEYYTTLIH